MWKSGDTIALRGIYNQRAWYVQSAVIVDDSPDRVVLAILPGAECVAHKDYIHGRHGASGKWDRWKDYMSGNWDMEKYAWRTNRLLILLEPDKYYATMLFWNHESNEFRCHYVNFQLPYARTPFSLDTLDLDIDIIINPDWTYEWKDIDDFERALQHGAFLPEWIQGIEAAKPEVLDRVAKRIYPFDRSWLNWTPDPNWTAPKLPDNWDRV